MKNNIDSARRFSSIVKKNNGRPVNNHLTGENNARKERTGEKVGTIAGQKTNLLPADILNLRVRADEDRPE